MMVVLLKFIPFLVCLDNGTLNGFESRNTSAVAFRSLHLNYGLRSLNLFKHFNIDPKHLCFTSWPIIIINDCVLSRSGRNEPCLVGLLSSIYKIMKLET